MSPSPYDRRSGRFADPVCKTIRPLNWVLLSVAPEFLCRSKGCLGVTWHLYLRYRHGEFTRGSPDRCLKMRSFRGPRWRCAWRPTSPKSSALLRRQLRQHWRWERAPRRAAASHDAELPPVANRRPEGRAESLRLGLHLQSGEGRSSPLAVWSIDQQGR